MDPWLDESSPKSSKSSSIPSLPTISIPKSYTLNRIAASCDSPSEDPGKTKETSDDQSTSKLDDSQSLTENEQNFSFYSEILQNNEKALKNSENNQVKSIKIPTRSYNAGAFQENCIPLSSESKIFIPKNKENLQDTKDMKNNPLEDIKKKYESLRKGIQERSALKQQLITRKYEKKLKNLEEKTLKKINNLKELEEFSIKKIKEATNLPSIQETSFSNPKPLSTVFSSPCLLLNTYKDKIFTSTDLKSVNSHRYQFTPGSSYLLLNSSTLLINSISCSEIQSLDLSTGTLKSIIPHSIPRRYAAFGFIGQYPALIGGLIDSKSTLTDSVEVLKDLSFWQSVSSLNRPRSHGYSLKHKEDTFLMGGFPYDLTNTIERFRNGHWETFSFRFKDKLYGYGLASYKDFIVVFGGAVKQEKHLRGQIFLINTETEEVLEQPLKSLFLNYSSQSSVVVDGVLFYLDCIQGKIVSQELTI